ncbi:carboxylesterase/lipase family protein [Fusibacter paucivorans]|uniref:Carboxylic ester hydrolase n=1 Tax=Fusibacter paucivorans TaxID=76009 RepID=A0ABS5PQP1_9FIRM|nr:carboxylesterase/lipase family protein [Fusibacter paucivorans]MBS7527247.1 carboxylesterase/lipase family protein [Fusibacter paucivorans]
MTTVKTQYGTVQGFQEDGLVKWFGIPFAKPPIDELRFRRAQPCEKWQDTKLCHKFGNKPFQFYPFEVGEIPEAYRIIPESEDCLTLNIWRPDHEQKKLPVIVWIYGGAFTVGESSDATYDGSSFAANDVMYVSFNYRLGPLGFYDFSQYDAENFDSNCGLSDQIMALKWIKANIEAFGGDPDNITIFGSSAGGASVCHLVAAPETKGLFQKAIAQSAVPDFGLSKTSRKHNADLLLEQLELTPDTIGNLLDMDLTAIIKANTFVHINGFRKYPGMYQPGPVLDDLLPEAPADIIAKGKASDIKLIIGTNRDEGNLFVSQKSVFPYTWEMVEAMFKATHREADLPRLVDLYAKTESPEERLNQFNRDRAFSIPSIKIADAQSQFNDVWMYRFDYAPAALAKSGLNATHGCEGPIALNTLKSVGTLSMMWHGTPEDETQQLIQEMHTAWINFAKYGDPNGSLPIKWEKYNQDNRKTLIFDSETHLEADPEKEHFEVWCNIKLYD